MQCVTQTIIEKLEELVDSHGIKGVLAALEEVCRLKADHLSSFWQDYDVANEWDKNAKRIAMVCRHVHCN